MLDYNIDKAKAVLRLNYPNAERVGAVHNPPAPRISVPPLARKRYKAPPTKWVPTGKALPLPLVHLYWVPFTVSGLVTV